VHQGWPTARARRRRRARRRGFYDTPPLTRVRDYSRNGVRRSLQESLERLGLDRVDIALIHDPDDFMGQAADEAYPALAELRAQGRSQQMPLPGNAYPGRAMGWKHSYMITKGLLLSCENRSRRWPAPAGGASAWSRRREETRSRDGELRTAARCRDLVRMGELSWASWITYSVRDVTWS
jgi:hypothetical protein